jgi:hypothetical protein
MNMQAATAQLRPYFGFPFQDRESRNRFIAGSALTIASIIIPIIPALFVYGYVLRIMRATADGEPPAMPAWEDWSSLLSVGVRGAIVNFVFLLPGMAVFFLGLAVYFGILILAPIVQGTPASSANPDAFFGFFMIGMGALFLCMTVGSILFLLGAIPLPAALAHFAAQDRLGAGFSVREWWPILKANKLGFFISFVCTIGIFGIGYYAFLILYSTLVLLCVAIFILAPVGFYTSLVGASLFGDAYREGRSLLEEQR